jgi:REP-associated tyrosine transposase
MRFLAAGRRYGRKMTTPLRNEIPGAIYHVTTRGDNQEPIYLDDADRAVFLWVLGRVARKYRWVGLAYCLMGNHYHLLLQIPFGGLSSGIDVLNSGYARRTNARYGRSGHVFGRRFYSSLIESDHHLLAACRYVVLNPIRASLCSRPEEWPWSSYRACAGLELANSFLATDELLKLFASDPGRARASYRSFVQEGQVPVAATGTRV